MTTPRCDNCLHFVRKSAHDGECHRHAPLPQTLPVGAVHGERKLHTSSLVIAPPDQIGPSRESLR